MLNLPIPKLTRLLFSRVCLTIKVFEMVNGEIVKGINVIKDIRELMMVVVFVVVIRS